MNRHNIILRSDIINLINDAREENSKKSELERNILDLIYNKLDEIVQQVPAADIACPHCGEILSDE